MGVVKWVEQVMNGRGKEYQVTTEMQLGSYSHIAVIQPPRRFVVPQTVRPMVRPIILMMETVKILP